MVTGTSACRAALTPRLCDRAGPEEDAHLLGMNPVVGGYAELDLHILVGRAQSYKDPLGIAPGETSCRGIVVIQSSAFIYFPFWPAECCESS